jgi:uncharacterized membrane protein YfcA
MILTTLGFLLIGLLVGIVSGMLGIGGGVILIPALMFFFEYKYTRAVGTTLAVMVPPVGLLAAWQYWREGHVDIHTAFWIALGFVLGAFFGALLKNAEILQQTNALRIAFALLLIYVAVRYLIETDSEVYSMALGLVSAAASLVAFLVLKAMGRHYRRRTLAEEIARRQQQQPPAEPDYYI